MALKVFDGFEKYNATADFLNRSGFLQYQMPGGFQPPLSFVTGRNGFGKAAKIQNNNAASTACKLRLVWGDRNAEAFVGIAVVIPGGSVGNAANLVVTLGDAVAGSDQVTLFFNGGNYSIQIFRGTLAGTSLYISSNNAWTPDVFNFIEIHGKIANSGGLVEVKINGVSKASVSSVDTQNSANAWFDYCDINTYPVVGALTVTFCEFDDLYYCDTTSGPGVTPCNTFLGDCQVKTSFATGNDVVQFTPLAGANWQEISEVAMDSDTSYNYSSTPGQQDTFVFQPLEATITTIYGIQLTYAARKDDAGMRTVESVVKISGTPYLSSPANSIPDTLYAYFTDLWILNPATTLNWTLSDVNGADYGYNLVS